jgi:hypothetical protein
VVHLGAVREAFASFESPEVFANSEGFEFIWEFGSSALVSAVPDAEFGGHDVDVLGVVVAAGAAPEEIVVQAGQSFSDGLVPAPWCVGENLLYEGLSSCAIVDGLS